MKKTFATLLVAALATMTAFGVDLNVSWNANPGGEGVSSYKVFVSTNGLPFVEAASVTTNAYTVVNPTTGVYSFRIAAVNLAGTGNQSATVSSPGLPSTPTGGTATAVGTTITVNWTPNDPNQYVTSYNVYVSTNGLPQVLATNVVAPPAVFPNLLTGVYSYRLSAVNLAGESGQTSPPISGPGLPSTVTGAAVAVTP